jgi:hypothetical protein
MESRLSLCRVDKQTDRQEIGIHLDFQGDTMDQSVELSLEQQFSLRSFETQVEKMSREQAQHLLIKLYERMTLRETLYKSALKQHWGIETNQNKRLSHD